MSPPIYVYYKLDNYYQNHRRYVKSRSSSQLLGKVTLIDEGCSQLLFGITYFPYRPEKRTIKRGGGGTKDRRSCSHRGRGGGEMVLLRGYKRRGRHLRADLAKAESL